MFNGIIKKTGVIRSINKSDNNCYLEIYSNLKFSKNEIGSSVSCSGACLTLEKFRNKIIKFYLSKETLKKTIFNFSKKGDIINLEKPIKYGESISGHFVQGHVDTTALVTKIAPVGKSLLINFQLSGKFKKYIIPKGSIAINGVSLTIAKILIDGFQVAVVPKSLKLTSLTNLKTKDIVNIEFDVLGKYIKNFVN